MTQRPNETVAEGDEQRVTSCVEFTELLFVAFGNAMSIILNLTISNV